MRTGRRRALPVVFGLLVATGARGDCRHPGGRPGDPDYNGPLIDVGTGGGWGPTDQVLEDAAAPRPPFDLRNPVALARHPQGALEKGQG